MMSSCLWLTAVISMQKFPVPRTAATQEILAPNPPTPKDSQSPTYEPMNL